MCDQVCVVDFVTRCAAYRLSDALCGADLAELQVARILGHGLTQLSVKHRHNKTGS